MHLSSLSLTNVRQFDQRTFEFQPGFNLLVGENGTGKTTILRGVLAALASTQQMGRRSRLEDDDIRLRTQEAEVRAAVQSSDNSIKEFLFRKTLWQRAERPLQGRRLPLVLHYASNEATCSALKVRQAKRIREAGRTDFRRDQEFLYQMEMRMEYERWQPGSNARRFGDSRSVRDFVGEVLSTFDPDFHRFYWRFEPYDCSIVLPSGEPKELVFDGKIEAAVRSAAMRYFQEDWAEIRKRPYVWPDQAKVVLYPGNAEKKSEKENLPDPRQIWENAKLQIAPESREILQDMPLEVKLTPRIMIQRKSGSLRLSQLSDGEQRLFSLFVDIARQLSLQNPTEQIGEGEAIVLIDEIDVHLHPKWQRKIVPALEDLFRSCQFIATTHSPFIVQATPSGSVQHINGRPIGDVADRGIEEIAKKAMGVEGEIGERYAEELEAAKDYLRALYATPPSSRRDIDALRRRLNKLGDRYARNPAYQAFLELKTDANFGSKE